MALGKKELDELNKKLSDGGDEPTALDSIAESLIRIEKCLFALVYLQNTKDPAKSGVTYIPEFFYSIFSGEDPLEEINKILSKATPAEPLAKDGVFEKVSDNEPEMGN